MLEQREQRTRPALDDKSLTSWNALMCQAYTDAYLAFGNTYYLHTAIKNARFILDKQYQSDHSLWHSYKDGQSSINGFLEDYALTISALIRLYEATFDEQWLNKAKDLTDYCQAHFYDSQSGMFFFTSDLDAPLSLVKWKLTTTLYQPRLPLWPITYLL